MKVLDIVSRNGGRNVFAITKIDSFDNGAVLTLVEVNPDKTIEHRYPNAEPMLISTQELQKFYTKIS